MIYLEACLFIAAHLRNYNSEEQSVLTNETQSRYIKKERFGCSLTQFRVSEREA